MSENEDIFHEEILKVLLKKQKIYIIVKTLFTIHHIEKLLGSVRDRGRWKWIAETDMKAFDKKDIPESNRSHIDGGDLFPRLYFNDDCFLKEFFSWLKVRDLKITDITVPKY